MILRLFTRLGARQKFAILGQILDKKPGFSIVVTNYVTKKLTPCEFHSGLSNKIRLKLKGTLLYEGTLRP